MADSIDHTEPNARLRKALEDLRGDPDALIEIIVPHVPQVRKHRHR
jgi:hypothetical protein